MKKYDYIIIGTGCAGLSLLMRILDNDSKQEKKILLVDKSHKNINDRTWCFWEKGSSYFEHIVYHRWDDLYVRYDAIEKKLNMGGYLYKMIRGIDFYDYCLNRIKQSRNIDIEIVDILSAEVKDKHCFIKTHSGLIEAQADFVFNSIAPSFEKDKSFVHLLQHFKGWIIHVPGETNSINPCLMDFHTSQTPGTAFVYTLPLDANRTLVEYTLFSSTVLPDNDYDTALKEYLQDVLKLTHYTIERTEFGIIPMTNYKFPFYKDGIYYIGTAGGQTKPSSGYTFSFIQKQAEYIASALLTQPSALQNNAKPFRFQLYDSILLNVLNEDKMPGKEIFKKLFDRLPTHQIFKFLDNETNLAEELKILNTMPTGIFLPVAIKQLIQQVVS